MKSLLRHYVIDTAALYLVSRLASGIVFERGIETVLLAGLGLTLVSLVIKPVITVLLLPINLITFGLFKWAGSAIALYLVTLLIPGFRILSFTFAGVSTRFFDIPSIGFSGILALVAFSFLLSLITSAMHWFMK